MGPQAPVQPGDIIAGKYRVDRILGAGGMGVVAAATHLELVQPVALKFLLSELAHRDDLVARFLREARNCVSISSEHVVRVMDVGRLETGAPYMVMEFLDGHDLETELRHRRTLDLPSALDIAIQTCLGLAEAHRNNLVHRDLKPANLFLTQRSDGRRVVKILDFGISKALDSHTTHNSLTKTNQSMGTPYYMSPEQVRAAPRIDVRTDIWSLGAIIYEMLGGAPPFQAESASAVCAKVLEASPLPLHQLRSDVSEVVWQLVAWCLRKTPEERPPNVGELARALAGFASPQSMEDAIRVGKVMGISIVPPPPLQQPPQVASGPAPVAAHTDTSFTRTGELEQKRNRSLVPILAACAAGLTVGGGIAATFYLQPDPSAAKPPITATAGVAGTLAPEPKAVPSAPPNAASATVPKPQLTAPQPTATATVEAPIPRLVTTEETPPPKVKQRRRRRPKHVPAPPVVHDPKPIVTDPLDGL